MFDFERPRDVFQNACGEIASALEENGFKYARSVPHATKRNGPWKFIVSFQSGRIGTDFSIHYAVHNNDYLDWLRQFGPMTWHSGLVTAMNVGFLTPIRNWMTVDIENPTTRQATITNALATVRDFALPFFDLFADPADFARSLVTTPHPGFFYENRAVEFVAWQLGSEDAERCMAACLFQLIQRDEEALDIFQQARHDPDCLDTHNAALLGRSARRLALNLPHQGRLH
jgi:hypothetical protein